MSKRYIAGPFGDGARLTLSHLLNALCTWGVPVAVVDKLSIQNADWLSYQGKCFAKFKYFDGVEQPLFFFMDPGYITHPFIVKTNGDVNEMVPNYRLSLSDTNRAVLDIRGPDVTDSLKYKLRETLTPIDDHDWFPVSERAQAVMETGYDRTSGEWVQVDFLMPVFAKEYLEKLNNEYRP